MYINITIVDFICHFGIAAFSKKGLHIALTVCRCCGVIARPHTLIVVFNGSLFASLTLLSLLVDKHI